MNLSDLGDDAGLRDDAGASPGPGLLILTGASHAGKTTLAEAVLDATRPPAALLSVDSILGEEIVRPPGDIWAEIPLAYELIASQLEVLLDRAWFVVVESTFTYVPREGRGELHLDQIERLIATAGERGLPSLLVQLTTGDDVTGARVATSGRLSPEIVAATAELHRAAIMPASALRLQASGETPAGLARRVLERFEGGSASG